MNSALLVIDIQNDYFPGGLLPLHKAKEVETLIVREIEHAASVGERVILIRHVSKASSGLFAANGTGSEIRPTVLAAASRAPIVIKQMADAFQDTDLTEHLAGIEKIRICGMMTQNCVVFTAMSEAAAPYEVTVLGDLCAAPSEVVHKVALNALGSKLRVENITSS
nr:isochorismatase family protein [uncultured Cohaesibacter sp.]